MRLENGSPSCENAVDEKAIPKKAIHKKAIDNKMLSDAPLYDSLVHAVLAHEQERPNDIAVEFVTGRSQGELITYQQLSVQAKKVAAYLNEHSQRGDRILIPTNNESSFYAAFLGCLFAGRIAVPVQVPRPKVNLPDLGLGRCLSVIKDAGVPLILIDDYYRDLLCKAGIDIESYLRGVRLCSIQGIVENTPYHAGIEEYLPDTESLAFLQYTSGSTAAPKGVMLTHRCIVENQRSMHRCYNISSTATLVSWLPLFHDMGLCTGLFMPLYLGVKAVMLEPLSFIAQPQVWLDTIAAYQQVVSGGPNFAFSHCVSRVSDAVLETLDLSGWDIAFCGAEPINPDTVDDFFAKFSKTGVRREAFFPSYGLAEATLFVSAKKAGELAVVEHFKSAKLGQHLAELATSEDGKKTSVEKTTRLMSCGCPNEGIKVEIVDPETRVPLREGCVGEIAVHSQSMGVGYWNNPEASADTFGQRVIGREQPYFLTGDYGFINNGQLYVSGRRKEVIILNGVNHYPQDVELTAQQQNSAFLQYKAAAFMTPDNRLIVVLEAKPDALPDNELALAQTIKQAIRAEHQVIADEVCFVSPGTIPRTTSGKVQRMRCMALYAKGVFHPSQAYLVS
jgi:acyl-CoA synthetase (AMP-forming)/AMP-acid ligase II